MPPTKIMIIRHGEKPEDGPPKMMGVNQFGVEDKHELIVQGWERAGALGRLFRPVSGQQPSGSKLAVPTALFAAGPNDTDKSVRAWHVLLPVSQLPNPIMIETRYGVGDEQKLADEIKQKPGVVLVAWEHKHIKDIVDALTDGKVKSPHWPGDRFDMVFVLTPGTSWQFEQVPQMVLPGDSATLFT
jgi:hypothetical protein